MTPELGIIEGFYGPQWSWQTRAESVTSLAPHGYGFYLHAPKGDPYLRRQWQEPHPAEHAARLVEFARTCRALDVRFGIGLSPYEIYLNFDEQARNALERKLAFLDEIGAQDVAILFDDMRGDIADLALRQIEIVHWIRERSNAQRIIFCPTYYSDDPILDRIFGERPDGYLERLGAGLDERIEIFWTGEEICAVEISVAHLERVRAQLRRRPFLWDNYPVNDSVRMSRTLHVRAFTGRPATIASHITAHGVNPALQPVLSRIPALTLTEIYRVGADYQYGAALRRAAAEVLGAELGMRLWEDLLTLQDVGVDRLDDAQRAHLRARYEGVDNEGAREIMRWVAGEYQVTKEMVEGQ
ncbi:MAG: beta-N-acetylglucosaminidase domain-containing protein [Longimicrobiales bacterium]